MFQWFTSTDTTAPHESSSAPDDSVSATATPSTTVRPATPEELQQFTDLKQTISSLCDTPINSEILNKLIQNVKTYLAYLGSTDPEYLETQHHDRAQALHASAKNCSSLTELHNAISEYLTPWMDTLKSVTIDLLVSPRRNFSNALKDLEKKLTPVIESDAYTALVEQQKTSSGASMDPPVSTQFPEFRANTEAAAAAAAEAAAPPMLSLSTLGQRIKENREEKPWRKPRKLRSTFAHSRKE